MNIIKNRWGHYHSAADVLNEAGIKSTAYVSPLTAHEWQSWRRSLYEFAQLLFINQK